MDFSITETNSSESLTEALGEASAESFTPSPDASPAAPAVPEALLADPALCVGLKLSNGQQISGKISLSQLKEKHAKESSLLHRQFLSSAGEFAYVPYPRTKYIVARVFGAGGNGGSILRTDSGQIAVASGGNSGNIAVSARFEARRLKKMIVGAAGEWTLLLDGNNLPLLKAAPGQSGRTALFKAGTTGFSPLNETNKPSEGDVLAFDIHGALGERGIVINGDPAAPLLLGGKGGSTSFGHGGLGGTASANSAQHATGFGSGGGGAAAGENAPANPGGKGASGFIMLEEYS